MSSNRKIAVLIGDGMADEPIAALGGKTPLEAARTPNMDSLARRGTFGLARTIPPGMDPGSDTANLSIMGYDPRVYFTGRAPLEALNMGIELGRDDVAFRCNIVRIDESGTMVDFSGGHIESDFGKVVIDELRAARAFPGIELYSGVSYRHLLVWRGYPHSSLPATTPPHDIQGKDSAPYLPAGDGAGLLREIMDLSRGVIASSNRIADAAARMRGAPTSVWLWGGGRKPSMPTLAERFGITGRTISAVDLIHGLGRAAGLTPLRVPGATGYIDTNYEGKADALIAAFETDDFVFLHVESPDESGHEGNLEHKLRAIEDFDARVVGRVLAGMARYDDYAVLVMPDHPTPIAIRTHSAAPVPFCIFDAKRDGASRDSVRGFSEPEAARTGIVVEDGHRLIEHLIAGHIG